VIDDSVVNEPMMWLMGDSAQMEANIGQKDKMNGRDDDEDGGVDTMDRRK